MAILPKPCKPYNFESRNSLKLDLTTLYSKCDQEFNLWQQIELASELESDLQDTLGWGKNWLADFNAGKTQPVSFDWPNNTGSIDVKMDGSVLEEKSSFNMLGLTHCSKLYWGSYIISIAKTIGVDLFYEVSFAGGCCSVSL